MLFHGITALCNEVFRIGQFNNLKKIKLLTQNKFWFSLCLVCVCKLKNARLYYGYKFFFLFIEIKTS